MFSRFIDQLSRSLYVEYKRMGIDVQCQVIINAFLHVEYSIHSLQTFQKYWSLIVEANLNFWASEEPFSKLSQIYIFSSSSIY